MGSNDFRLQPKAWHMLFAFVAGLFLFSFTTRARISFSRHPISAQRNQHVARIALRSANNVSVRANSGDESEDESQAEVSSGNDEASSKSNFEAGEKPSWFDYDREQGCQLQVLMKTGSIEEAIKINPKAKPVDIDVSNKGKLREYGWQWQTGKLPRSVGFPLPGTQVKTGYLDPEDVSSFLGDKSLGFPKDVGNYPPNCDVEYEHSLPWDTHKATSALYEFTTNNVNGLIVVPLLKSPTSMVKDPDSSSEEDSDPSIPDRRRSKLIPRAAGLTMEDIPPINHASDFMYGAWTNPDCKKYIEHYNEKGLRVVVHLTVDNDETRGVLYYAAKEKYKTFHFTPWGEGHLDFTPQDGALFDALIGTPNARSVAWSLIQHKGDYGLKTISQVSVFASDQPFAMQTVGKVIEGFDGKPYKITDEDIKPFVAFWIKDVQSDDSGSGQGSTKKRPIAAVWEPEEAGPSKAGRPGP